MGVCYTKQKQYPNNPTSGDQNQGDQQDIAIPTNEKNTLDEKEASNKIQDNEKPEFKDACFIKIINNTESTVFIRISAYFSTDSVDWCEVNPTSDKTWIRKKGSYFVEYSLIPEECRGPVVILLTNETYSVEPDFRMTNSKKVLIPFTSENFPEFEDKDNDGINDQLPIIEEKVIESKKNNSENLNDPDLALLQGSVTTQTTYTVTIQIQSNMISIVNFCSSLIRVRIKAFGSGSEALYPINVGSQQSWNRKTGSEYLMEVVFKDKKFRFKVKPSNAYVFNRDFSLEDFYSNDIPVCYEPFDQFSPKDDSNHVIVRTDNKIRIANRCSYRIYARVQSKGKGTDELLSLEAGREDAWCRDVGKYMLEIVKNGSKFRFYVNSNKAYKFSDNDILSDTDSGEEIKSTLEDVFPNPKSGGTSNNISNNNSNNISNPRDNSNSNNNNSNQDSNVPYWNNKKPLISTGTFIDEDFPPHKRIINSYDMNGRKLFPKFLHCQNERLDDSELCFKRPTEIWGNNYQLFSNDISIDDVKQGGIGDCYLIASLAALARRPELIRNIFKTSNTNSQGLYEIYIYYQGKKHILFVDDHLIYSNYGRQYVNDFLFANPNGSELWVLLLEKAFAKFEGGFSNIVGGVCSQVFTFLTGAATTTTSGSNKIANCWDEIKTCIAKNNIIACGSNQGSGTHNDKSMYGIHYSHAYSLNDAREYDDGRERIRLVKVRNPWGQKEWQGAFSDSSNKWTPALKKYFNLEVKEDGSFWMPFEDFCKEFNTLYICYISDKR